MFTRKKSDFAYVFPFSSPRRLAITMFFVFYPIDILFLKEGKVVEIVQGLRPFTHYVSKKKADTFIELPSKKVDSSMLGKRVTYSSSVVHIADK